MGPGSRAQGRGGRQGAHRSCDLAVWLSRTSVRHTVAILSFLMPGGACAAKTNLIEVKGGVNEDDDDDNSRSRNCARSTAAAGGAAAQDPERYRTAGANAWPSPEAQRRCPRDQPG